MRISILIIYFIIIQFAFTGNNGVAYYSDINGGTPNVTGVDDGLS